MIDSRQQLCEQYATQLQIIENMIAKIDQSLIGERFSVELHQRVNRSPNMGLSDSVILNRMIDLIAYSSGARSAGVEVLIATGIFTAIFQGYNVQDVSRQSSDKILVDFWGQLGAIRFRKKIPAMIDCARVLLRLETKYGSFMNFLQACQIPTQIKTDSDFHEFWIGFEKVRLELNTLNISYVGNFTTLCHLLMDLGYDCAKPDSAIMRASVDLQIVPKPKKQRKNPERDAPFSERELKQAIQTIQVYAMCHQIRAAVVDLYFLVHGGQSSVVAFVNSSYYLQ